MRGWGVVAGAALAIGLGAGQAGAEARRLLGTVRVTGPVEAALPGGVWHPMSGGAAVEGMRIRTGPGGVAVVELADGDVLGLAESSSCELGSGRPARVRLLDGRFVVRLRPDSPVVIDAASASVRGSAASPVATGQREALVALGNGTVVVRPYRGSFEVAGPSAGPVTQVAPGQEATLAAGAEAPTVVAATTPAPDDEAARRKAEGGFLAALGLTPTTAALIGGGAAAVGGAVGGAAAGGAFSSGGSSSESGGGSQGSPFRPIRR